MLLVIMSIQAHMYTHQLTDHTNVPAMTQVPKILQPIFVISTKLHTRIEKMRYSLNL